MALRQHYSLIQIMERLLEIIEDVDTEDHEEELYTLPYWLGVDRFDRADCPLCGKARLHKGYHTHTYRTLFGKLRLRSVRLYHCKCHHHRK